MNAIPDKLQVITEVLDLTSQHVPEGKYLAAMTAVRDIYNMNNVRIEKDERFIQMIHEALYQSPSWWNRRSLTNGEIVGAAFVGTLFGLIGFVGGNKLIAKFR